jgi:hypothetical protein
LLITSLLVITNLSLGIQTSQNSERGILNQIEKASTSKRDNLKYHWSSTSVPSEPIEDADINTFSSNNSKIVVENDKIYLVWEDTSNLNGAGTDSDIMYRYFDGNSWSKIDIVSEPKIGKNINLGDSHEPDIVVENGNVYVVWYDNNNTNKSGSDYDIFYRSNMTGKGWDSIQVISEPVIMADNNLGWSISPTIDVENGSIHVCWQDDSNFNNAAVDWDIFYRDNLTGAGWGPIQVISEPVSNADLNKGESREPDINVDDYGNIYIVWYDDNDTMGSGNDNDILFRSNLTGSGWGSISVLSEPKTGSNINTGDSKAPTIVAVNGNMHLAWHDNNDTNGCGADYDIFYKYYNSNKWTAVQIISEPEIGKDNNIGGSLYPVLDVDNGREYLVWHDTNDTASSGYDTDIFYRYRTIGNSWSAIEVVSEPLVGSNMNQGKSLHPDINVRYGKTHIVWADNNNTNYAGIDRDIFYRTTLNSPTLQNGMVSPKTGYSSTYFNFTVQYLDPDNQAPLYIKVTLSGINYTMLEANITDDSYYNGKLFYYTTTLGIGTDYNFSFFSTDGTYLVSTGIIDGPDVINFQPKIVTENVETAFEDIYYEVGYVFEDQDVGQAHVWTFTSNALGWLSFDSTDAILYGTPLNEHIGEYWVNISISDELGALNWTYFTLTVVNVNDLPDIEIIGNLTAVEDKYYQISIKATDIDTSQTKINLSVITNATWLTKINESALNTTFQGTPRNDDVGIFTINITANDTEGGISYDERLITVLNVNDPPKILTMDVLDTWPGQLYAVNYSAKDIDPGPQTLTWSYDSNAGNWLAMNLMTGWLNGTPSESNIGAYWVNVSVNDGNGGMDYHNFTLTVNLPPNQPPVINISVVNTTAVTGDLYLQTINVTDDRTIVTDLNWTLNSNADWLVFLENSRQLKGTPEDKDVGVYWVNLSVVDAEGGFAYNNFTIEVIPSPNFPPVLTAGQIKPEDGDTDTEFKFSVRYFDPDGDPPYMIKVVIDGNEHVMELDSGTASNGTYIYKTKLSQGKHTFYFTASDGNKTAVAGDTSTPIGPSTSRETSDIEKASDGTDWILILLIIIVIILIVAIILAALYRPKKPQVSDGRTLPEEDEEYEEETEDEEDEDETEDEEDEDEVEDEEDEDETEDEEDEDEVEDEEEYEYEVEDEYEYDENEQKIEDEFELELDEDLEPIDEDFEIELDEENEEQEWEFEE